MLGSYAKNVKSEFTKESCGQHQAEGVLSRSIQQTLGRALQDQRNIRDSRSAEVKRNTKGEWKRVRRLWSKRDSDDWVVRRRKECDEINRMACSRLAKIQGRQSVGTQGDQERGGGSIGVNKLHDYRKERRISFTVLTPRNRCFTNDINEMK